ncbi:MAG: phage head closure protein [Jhaorihella sp.]
MTAPRLNRRLVLKAPVRVDDGAGGFVETWTERGEVWAEVSARSGRERGLAGTPIASVAYRIVVRAAPQGSAMRPQAGQRLCDGAQVFVIRAVAERGPDARHLICFADAEVVA